MANQFQVVPHYIEDENTEHKAQVRRYEQRIKDLEKENDGLR